MNEVESRLYIDGAAAGDGFIGNVPASAGFGSNMGMNGTVDEVRIATRVRSAAWIAAEFANQSSPTTFYTVGGEEPL